jgi:hypothetical protein
MRQKLLVSLLVSGFFSWLLLSAAIYLYGIYLAAESGAVSLLLYSFVPLVGQAFLTWSMWSATGMFFNSYTIAVLSWVALGAVLGNLANLAQRR